MHTLRLIIDKPRPATLQMAIDEYLMNSQRAEDAQPTVRFYSWPKSSISIGYFQKVEEAVQKYDTKKKSISVVRRISGGGTVEHGEDLTFCLAIKTINPFFPSDVKSAYLGINEAVRVGLKELYPKLDYTDCRTVPTGKRQSGGRICFEAPACYDLMLGGKKILGASQRRIEKNLLHQSTMFLKENPAKIIQGILNGFESLWKVNFEKKPLSEEELTQARQLERKRYGSKEWANPTV